MTEWLLAAVLAAAQVVLRVVNVVGVVWQEHARARANCLLMQSASTSTPASPEKPPSATGYRSAQAMSALYGPNPEQVITITGRLAPNSASTPARRPPSSPD